MNQPPAAPDQLWTSADLAAYLRVDAVDPKTIAAAGVPFFVCPGLGLRAVPELVRAWAVTSSRPADRPAAIGWVPAKKRKVRVGSGAARVQP